MSRRGAFVKLNSDSNSENGVRVRFTNYLSLNSAQQASSSFGGRSIDLHRIYLYFIIRNDLAAQHMPPSSSKHWTAPKLAASGIRSSAS
jgi:hypothetical protein